MNFMSIISAIVTFIRYVPELIKIWKEVSGLLQDITDKVAAKKKAEEVAQAIKKARETKDTSDLEDMFGPKSFNITFKTEEKKSLDLGALKFDAKIEKQKKLTQQVEEFFAKEEPNNPLKEVEKYVVDLGSQYGEEPKEDGLLKDDKDDVMEKNGLFSFMSFGRSSGAVIGESFVNHVNMSGKGRMGSTFFALAFILVISGCKTGAKNEPNYKPELYAGDSSQGGLYRKQSDDLIKGTDPEMDEMVGMKYSTFACIHKTYIQNCREYKEQVVSCEGLNSEFFKDYIKSK